ncbi:GH116 family glycosyl-hydrolase, partial [Acidobacteriota bacterium]
MKKISLKFLFLFLIATFLIPFLLSCSSPKDEPLSRTYNGPYSDTFNSRVAWPIGGIGAGMICLDGRGSISHVSLRNKMEVSNEPCAFAAVSIKGENGNTARILEGPVPDWKIFGMPRAGNGAGGTSYGLPRFNESEFLARFPFGTVTLSDPDISLEADITGWSPFIPGDADNASLPVGTLEYSFKNPTGEAMEVIFSY